MSHPPSPQGCCRTPTSDLDPTLTKVKSRLVGPDGRPLAGREVAAILRAAPSWLADRTGRVLGTATTRTDKDGWWEMKLLPSAAVETSDYVYYEVVENNVTSYARVPPTPGEVHLRDILIEVPPDPPRWRPIDALPKLHDVDPNLAEAAQAGQVLGYDGRLWVAVDMVRTLGQLGNVDPEADADPTPGQALVFDGERWVPTTLPAPTGELAKLGDVHPSVLDAAPGDALVCVEEDPETGRALWGVERPPAVLEMEFGGQSGAMEVVGALVSPDVADKPIDVHWEGRPDGATTTIPAGGWHTSHTYAAPGTYAVAYRYTDDSDSGVAEVTVPLP